MAHLSPLPYHRQAFSTPLGAWEFLIAPPPPDLLGIVRCFWISRGQLTFLHDGRFQRLTENGGKLIQGILA